MTLAEFQDNVNRQAPGAEIRFCGGEPTFHQQFSEMLIWAIHGTANPVIIMTNGIWPDRIREKMAGFSVEEWKRVSILFNLLEEDFYTPEDYKRLIRVLETVYPLNAIIGFTIYTREFRFKHILDLAVKFNIPSLRYSIAAPTTGNWSGRHFRPEDYAELATPVYDFIMAADKLGLAVSSDCGYIPFCMFSEKQQRDLLILSRRGSVIKFHCDSATDIGSGGEAWRCYGLYDVLRTRTDRFKSIEEATLFFDNQVRQLNPLYMYEACKHCEFIKGGICGGGCYVYRVAERLEKDESFNPFPLDDDLWLLNARPKINPEVSLWTAGTGERAAVLPVSTRFGRTLLHFQDGENPVSFYEVFKGCTGDNTVQEIIDKWVHRFDNEKTAAQFVLYAVRLFFTQKAVDFFPSDI